MRTTSESIILTTSEAYDLATSQLTFPLSGVHELLSMANRELTTRQSIIDKLNEKYSVSADGSRVGVCSDKSIPRLLSLVDKLAPVAAALHLGD